MTATEHTPRRAAHEVIVAMCAELPADERAQVADAIGRLAEMAYEAGRLAGRREALAILRGAVR